MVQKLGSWQWLLEGFKYELEAQIRLKTVEYYHDHVRIFVRWVENTGITEARSLTKRDIHSFFHHIITNSHRAKRNNGAGEEARHAESLRFHYYRGLKRFFSWLSTEGYLERNPLDGIRFKAPKDPPIEPYQPEHKNKFLAVLDYDWKVAKTPHQKMLATRDKAILCLFVESGVRLQELAAMYYGLNPVLLLKQINENLEYLWKLAERPAHEQSITTIRLSTFRAKLEPAVPEPARSLKLRQFPYNYGTEGDYQG